MKCEVKINKVKSINEIAGYWKNETLIQLLEAMEFPDAKEVAPDELREMVEMALTDLEPHEAAEILLRHSFTGIMKEGTIVNVSHEMIDDKIAEEYPDISLHYPLYNINQFLMKAFNGKFPNTKATQIDLELVITENLNHTVTKEIALKALSEGLNDNNLVNRLYENQMLGKEECTVANAIIWELNEVGQNQYTLITSDYWINEEDIVQDAYTSTLKFAKHKGDSH